MLLRYLKKIFYNSVAELRVNKDFSTYRKAVLLAGSPAKVIKEHCSHIRSSKLEKEIDKFFKDNKEKTLYKFDMK